jgi:esterase/lipase
MKQVYCISGLGADERIFQRLRIDGVQFIFLQWITPLHKETIEAYAKRMSLQVVDENAILMGVSFGGMMAIEIGKHISAQKIILLSSIKSHKELPRWMKICGRLKLNKLAPARRPFKWMAAFENNFLGTRGIEEETLANEFRQTIDPHYLKWAIDKVVNWQNEIRPSSLYHIHGTNDKTFPIKNIQPTYRINGGSHFMVMNRAEEISGLIGSILNL